MTVWGKNIHIRLEINVFSKDSIVSGSISSIFGSLTRIGCEILFLPIFMLMLLRIFTNGILPCMPLFCLFQDGRGHHPTVDTGNHPGGWEE